MNIKQEIDFFMKETFDVVKEEKNIVYIALK